MKIVNLTNSEYYSWGKNCDGWHFLKRDDFSVIKEKMPSGSSEQLHFHQKSRQFFYILNGIATFYLQKEKIILCSGEGLEIPPQVPHQICNENSDSLEFILFSYPTTQGDRINLEAK